MAQAGTSPTAKRRIDPRVERSRRVILTAAREELAATGCGAFTIEAVAARAGVAKATVYRHWPGKMPLITEALGALKARIVMPATGALRERLTVVLEQVTRLLERSTYSRCLPALIEAAGHDVQLREIHRRLSNEHRSVLMSLLRDAVGEELPRGCDPALLADAMIGPIFLRHLLREEPLDARTIVDQLLPSSSE